MNFSLTKYCYTYISYVYSNLSGINIILHLGGVLDLDSARASLVEQLDNLLKVKDKLEKHIEFLSDLISRDEKPAVEAHSWFPTYVNDSERTAAYDNLCYTKVTNDYGMTPTIDWKFEHALTANPDIFDIESCDSTEFDNCIIYDEVNQACTPTCEILESYELLLRYKTDSYIDYNNERKDRMRQLSDFHTRAAIPAIVSSFFYRKCFMQLKTFKNLRFHRTD